MKSIWKQDIKSVSLVNKQTVTVVGTVTPIGWDLKGNPIKFSIYTRDDEDLIVENSSLNHKLCSLLNRTVEATGRLYKNRDKENCMRVEKIQELRGPSSAAPAILSTVHENNFYEEYTINAPNSFKLTDYILHTDRI